MVVLYRIGIAKKQFNYFFACVPRHSTETHIKYPWWRHGLIYSWLYRSGGIKQGRDLAS